MAVSVEQNVLELDVAVDDPVLNIRSQVRSRSVKQTRAHLVQVLESEHDLCDVDSDF